MKFSFKRIWSEFSLEWRQKVVDLIRRIIAGMTIVLVNRLWHSYGGRAITATEQLIGPYRTKIIIGIVVVVLGFVTYEFKRLNQRWYGFVEVIFGIVYGFSIAFTMAPDKANLPQWASLVGCAYVISRGMNNMNDAKKARQSTTLTA